MKVNDMRNITWFLFILFFGVSLHAASVDKYAIDSEKNILALAYEDNTVRLYSLDKGTLLRTLKTTEKIDDYLEMFGIREKDGKLLSLYSEDAVVLWDMNTGEYEIKKPDISYMLELQNSMSSQIKNKENNETWLLSDNLITIVDSTNKKEKAFIKFKALDIDKLQHLSLSPDGKSAAITVYLNSKVSKVLILDTETYAIQTTISPLSKMLRGTKFLDNTTLLLDSVYPTEVWDIQKHTKKFSFTTQGSNLNLDLVDIAKMDFKPYRINSRINGIDINPKTGNILVTGTGHPLGAVELQANGKLKQIFQNAYSTGYDTRYSPNGKLAAFAFHGEHLLVYDVETGLLNKEYDLGGVPNGTRIIKFSHNGDFLAAGSDGNTLSIIDLKKKQIIENFSFSSGVFSLQWINNKKILVGTLLELYELDLNTKKKRTILDTPSIALDAVFKNDKLELLAVGREEKGLLLLDKNYKTVKSHTFSGVGRLHFTKDGQKLIATSDYQTLIWDYNTSKSLLCEDDNQLWAMGYDKENKIIYAAGDDGIVHKWDMNCTLLN